MRNAGEAEPARGSCVPEATEAMQRRGSVMEAMEAEVCGSNVRDTATTVEKQALRSGSVLVAPDWEPMYRYGNMRAKA
ncbi:hypothetical protein [Paenibacillus thalictri]|uniref:Uncharacterized protein n=1 Tax=Paenibacillus thalictri TaxID=2527873 RepID=A0A4Q9DFX8_9BACL|nr:hypothetical protein [Paenibacillus thalictri]TBL68193.1 hypothetical protein EYB31_38585 [Paenibacillus thalictri]